jgi:bifunctional DNA-binding transcriptional regulator/antitoxin component of YhaV-PrlF toxin-antitoxin module
MKLAVPDVPLNRFCQSDNLKVWQGRYPQLKNEIGRVGQRRQVVIPREFLETLKLQEGDFVAFSKQANGVLIKPKRLVDPDDVLTPAQAKKLRRSLKQARQGKTLPWSQVKREDFRSLPKVLLSRARRKRN